MSVKYIDASLGGWLLVVRERDGVKVSLPHHLQVNHQRTANGRDYFRAMEGVHKGVDFHVIRKPHGGSYLAPYAPRLGPGEIQFNRSVNQLWYPGAAGPIYTFTDPNNPVPVGTYDLEIPDHPHPAGLPYTTESLYTTVWFRIRPGGASTSTDRYLHAGTRTAGCVTVVHIERWTEIFNHLIDRRKNDVSVGTIRVFG